MCPAARDIDGSAFRRHFLEAGGMRSYFFTFEPLAQSVAMLYPPLRRNFETMMRSTDTTSYLGDAAPAAVVATLQNLGWRFELGHVSALAGRRAT